MNLETLGRWMLVMGLALAITGGLIWLAGRFLPNIGKFPGTIRIEGSSFTCFIPLLASIILSIVLTVVLNLIIKFLNR